MSPKSRIKVATTRPYSGPERRRQRLAENAATRLRRPGTAAPRPGSSTPARPARAPVQGRAQIRQLRPELLLALVTAVGGTVASSSTVTTGRPSRIVHVDQSSRRLRDALRRTRTRRRLPTRTYAGSSHCLTRSAPTSVSADARPRPRASVKIGGAEACRCDAPTRCADSSWIFSATCFSLSACSLLWWSAEEQLEPAGQGHAYVGLRPAAVAAVGRVQGGVFDDWYSWLASLPRDRAGPCLCLSLAPAPVDTSTGILVNIQAGSDCSAFGISEPMTLV